MFTLVIVLDLVGSRAEVFGAIRSRVASFDNIALLEQCTLHIFRIITKLVLILSCGNDVEISPVCVRMWPRSSHGLENAFPHVVHTQGSVCERMCIFRAPKLVYSLGQCLQRKAGLVDDTDDDDDADAAAAAVTGASLSSSSSGGLTWAMTPVHFILCRGTYVRTGSGLGGSDVRPSSSSPLLLALLLRLDGELRSRGPGVAEGSAWDVDM